VYLSGDLQAVNRVSMNPLAEAWLEPAHSVTADLSQGCVFVRFEEGAEPLALEGLCPLRRPLGRALGV
jgi:hypothetical protein